MCEIATVYNETEVKRARKEHKCCECDGSIKAGTPYVSIFGVWSGEARTYKQCPECNALMHDIAGETCDTENMSGLTMLYEDVFESDNAEWMERYVVNTKLRGGGLGRGNWMESRLSEAKLAEGWKS